MKRRTFEKMLKKSGFVLERSNKHFIYKNEKNETIIFPKHNELNKMLTARLIKEFNLKG